MDKKVHYKMHKVKKTMGNHRSDRFVLSACSLSGFFRN